MATAENTATEDKLIDVLHSIAKERNISFEMLLEALEAALLTAYKRHFGTESNAIVTVDRQSGAYRVFHRRTVVDEVQDPEARDSGEGSRCAVSGRRFLRRRGDAERLRPNRRADGQASHRAAHSRSRARYGLQQIRAQAKRFGHRHDTALRAAQHVHHPRGTRRGGHVPRRASSGRSLSHQRLHSRLRARRQEVAEGTAGNSVACRRGLGAAPARARGARDCGRDGRDHGDRARSGEPLEGRGAQQSRRSGSDRSVPRSRSRAGSRTSRTISAARRSTSSATIRRPRRSS